MKTWEVVTLQVFWVWRVSVAFHRETPSLIEVPANSIILSQIAGSTSGAPDGATFLDNLFGSGAFAPTQRLFSLSLARREDVRTSSTLGIGAISEAYCPTASCKPKYLPIIPQPSLGLTGYLHWRLPLQGIIATTFANQQTGQGVTTRNTPLAVLDSGGVAILAGYKPWVDSIYAAFGVSASSDGLCEWQSFPYCLGSHDRSYALHSANRFVLCFWR